jgi:hypothetical protein
MGAVLLLLVLKSRTDQNISADALSSFEDSNLGGLITKEVPKQIFDLISKHYTQMIKDNQMR